MEPIFSIIIPTFNSSVILKSALESILNQSYDNYEILIMDGASTDNTIEIVQSYKDERIKIYSEPDNGIYDAMNKGIKVATGQWLYFLGSDDELYENNILEKIYTLIKRSKSKVIYGNALIIGDAGWAKNQAIYDGEFTLNKLINKNICHQSIFYNQIVFKKKTYNTLYNICADYDMNTALWSEYKFEYIPLIISKFRGGGSSFKKADENFSKGYPENIKKYFKFWFLNPEFSFLLAESNIPNIIKRSLRIYYKFLNKND